MGFDLTPLIVGARDFALQRHGNQTYGDGLPYETHLAAVVAVLEEHGVTAPDLLAAGWLHDVVEDTATTIEEIRREFGLVVGNLVWAVTGVGPNRKARNLCMFEKVLAYGVEGQGLGVVDNGSAITLKLADRIANVRASEPGSRHRGMYESEWVVFRAALYHTFPDDPAGNESMWKTLSELLGPSN